jgi:hypothetical protein
LREWEIEGEKYKNELDKKTYIYWRQKKNVLKCRRNAYGITNNPLKALEAEIPFAENVLFSTYQMPNNYTSFIQRYAWDDNKTYI